MANTEPAWVCARSSVYMLWLLACVFMGFLTVPAGVSLTPSPALGTLSSDEVALSTLDMRAYA